MKYTIFLMMILGIVVAGHSLFADEFSLSRWLLNQKSDKLASVKQKTAQFKADLQKRVGDLKKNILSEKTSDTAAASVPSGPTGSAGASPGATAGSGSASSQVGSTGTSGQPSSGSSPSSAGTASVPSGPTGSAGATAGSGASGVQAGSTGTLGQPSSAAGAGDQKTFVYLHGQKRQVEGGALTEEGKKEMKVVAASIPTTAVLATAMGFIAAQNPSDEDEEDDQQTPMMSSKLKKQMLMQQAQDAFSNDDLEGKSADEQRQLMEAGGGYAEWSGESPE